MIILRGATKRHSSHIRVDLANVMLTGKDGILLGVYKAVGGVRVGQHRVSMAVGNLILEQL